MTSFLQFSAQHGASFMFLPFFFTLFALSLTVFLLKKWLSFSKSESLPPSPPKLPILGNLHQLGLHPHRSLRSMAQTYGPLMSIHLGSVPVLVISSAELAREIMKTHDLVFADRPNTKIGRMLLYDNKDVSAAPYGEYWRRTKSVCVLHLLSNRRVQSYAKVREEETALMVEEVKNFCSSSASPVNISEVIVRMTNHVVSRIALGRKYSPIEGGRSFKELLAEFLCLLGSFNVGDYIPWLGWVNYVNGLYSKAQKVSEEIDNFLEKVLEEHATSGGCHDDNNKDFVDVLLWLQKENLAGFPIDRTCIKALILDVFAAGTDTTYTVVEWTMTELLRHPDAMKKVQTELRQNAKGKSFVKEEELSKMHYLKAVIKETLRLHPPIPLLVPRLSMKDVDLQGFKVSARTGVFINAFAIGRDPKTWDRPEEFCPDRFLNSSIDFKGQDFELIPFGSGRRICPGVQFAMSTDELALANLLYSFDWSLQGVAEAKDLDTSECTGLTIHRKFPLVTVASPYNY